MSKAFAKNSEINETAMDCKVLKMQAKDGKIRMSDTASFARTH
jgi:hypothetical protein